MFCLLEEMNDAPFDLLQLLSFLRAGGNAGPNIPFSSLKTLPGVILGKDLSWSSSVLNVAIPCANGNQDKFSTSLEWFVQIVISKFYKLSRFGQSFHRIVLE